MSWFDKKRNIAITVGAGILAILCIISITYAVITHEEPTLLEVCWTDGKAQYMEGATEEDYGVCSRGKELVWPKKQIPLTVAAVAAYSEVVLAPGASGRKALDSAIKDINRQVGCEVLRPTALRNDASILARLGEPVGIYTGGDRKGKGEKRGNPPLGFARHTKKQNKEQRRDDSNKLHKLHCNLTVYSHANNIRWQYLVVHHELLHCIGLTHHPDNPSSAMYPFSYDDTMWDRMSVSWITDGQLSALRRLYCE